MPRQQFQRYETGKVEPTLQVAVRIAEVLGISVDELAGRVPLDAEVLDAAALEHSEVDRRRSERRSSRERRSGLEPKP
jgi:transcriptional regulator with XRE-family HTH domain